MELSDEAFGEIESPFHELSDAKDIKNAELFRSPIAEENGDSKNVNFEVEKEDTDSVNERTKYADISIKKDAEIVETGTKNDETVDEDEDKASVNSVDSKEEKTAGRIRRPNAGRRRMLKQQRMRHQHRMHLCSKGCDIVESHAEEESNDHDGETAHFYYSKPSDIANMSADLGPGPVSIQLVDPTTQKATTQRLSTQRLSTQRPTVHSTIIGSSTMLGLSDIRHVVNLTSENDELCPSLVGGHRRGNRRRFKSHYDDGKNNDAVASRDEESLPGQNSKKEGRMFRKHNSKFHDDDHTNTNQRAGHRKRNHDKVHKETIGLSSKKNLEKIRLNDEEQYRTLSDIKKGVRGSEGKPVTSKTSVDNPSNAKDSDVEELEIKTNLDDKTGKDDTDDLSLINAGSEESQASLKDENIETDTKNKDKNSRPKLRKGIRSKIEHGDWIDHVTLFTLPNYSVKKNRAHHKRNKLTLLDSLKKSFSASDDASKLHNNIKEGKKKDSIDGTNKGAGSRDKTKSRLQSGSEFYEDPSEYVSDVGLADGDTGFKRKERDAKERDVGRNSKLPKRKGFFDRLKDNNYEKDDEMYDADTKHSKQSYSSLKKNGENAYGNHKIPEKDEYDYEYDSNLSGGEKAPISAPEPLSVHDFSDCPVNMTSTTQSTCMSTTETVCSSKPTRRPTKPKSSTNEVRQKDTSNDPFEMFLNGQLADNFVDEVLRKVRISRKISRELGYTNETEETCDRCIELKPMKLPERDVMRNTLGKCPRSRTTGKNNSVCYRVPPPMAKFLDVLVFYEKENENSFYNKIQDDSSFIFTGDYPESLSKGGNSVKYTDPYESSFNKDALDRQRLKEDMNEEKNEDKISDSHEKQKEKSEEYATDDDTAGEDIGKAKEAQGGIKKYTRRYSKIKIDRNEETFPDLTENMREDDPLGGFSSSELDPLVKDHSSNIASASAYTKHHRAFGALWKNADDTINDYTKDQVNTPQGSEVKPAKNFDRYYGKSNYDYYKQYPAKNAPIKPFSGYKSNFGDPLKNNWPKDGRDRHSFYKIPESIGVSNKDDHLNLKSIPNFFGYNTKKHEPSQKINLNEKYNGYNPKVDGLYNYNGEYPLYPNLDGRPLEDELVKTDDVENARMVKRYAENSAAYDDEPNVFFEIPNIEYDLY